MIWNEFFSISRNLESIGSKLMSLLWWFKQLSIGWVSKTRCSIFQLGKIEFFPDNVILRKKWQFNMVFPKIARITHNKNFSRKAYFTKRAIFTLKGFRVIFRAKLQNCVIFKINSKAVVLTAKTTLDASIWGRN